MIKPDAPIMQTIHQDEEVEVPPERRAFLAIKGQRLYGKYCGTNGRGICAESFAEYHIWRGELIVARDLLAYLNAQIACLHQTVPTTPEIETQLHMTEGLIERITALLGECELKKTIQQKGCSLSGNTLFACIQPIE
jgi:hypothetical protein